MIASPLERNFDIARKELKPILQINLSVNLRFHIVTLVKQYLAILLIQHHPHQMNFSPSLIRFAAAQAVGSQSFGGLPPKSGFDKPSGFTMMLFQITAFTHCTLIAFYSSPILASVHPIQCKGFCWESKRRRSQWMLWSNAFLLLPFQLVSQLENNRLWSEGNNVFFGQVLGSPACWLLLSCFAYHTHLLL